VDRLVRRAEVLCRADQALIAAIYLEHQTVAAVAFLQGVSVRVLRRRLYRIIRRVHTPEFIYVLRRHDQWRGIQRRVATAIFLRGLTMHQAARELKLPYFTVRRLRDIVRTLIDGEPDEAARASAGEEHGGSQREQSGDWIAGGKEESSRQSSSQVASRSSAARARSIKFPNSRRFGEVA
jgi:hypothetical protein